MRKQKLQTNFSAGELDPDLSMRMDTDQYQSGARSLLNRRLLIGGGHVRRPGSTWLALLSQQAVIVEFIADQSTQYLLLFSDGRMDAYLPDGTAAGSITGAPWTGTIWQELDWAQMGNAVLLTNEQMPPQIITRTGTATWTRAAFTFFTGPGGKLQQPYYKVAGIDVTLQPSALTGSITLEASAAVFDTGSIGTRFRYLKREIEITGVTDADTATGTVIQNLPGTQELVVTSTANFAVGEVVQGETSGAKGQVTEIVDGTTMVVVIIEKLTPFETEDLIGPNATTTISATASDDPAAVTDWDQAIFTDAIGYPATVELHRARVLFAGHPAVPNALMGSSLINIYNFDVGDQSDGDAIFETIGDAAASKIVQLHSAEQLLVLTDNGPYYVPETTANPFKPTGISFAKFGSTWPISRARVRSFDGGAIMTSGSLVIKARPTGNLTQAWDADEVSLLAPHLINTPDELAVCSNFDGGPERYAFIRNDDGTLAVMQLVEVQKIRNFTPWETEGQYLSIGCLEGEVYAVAQRTIDGNTVYVLEHFDQDITLDAATEYADLNDVASRYGETEVNVVTETYHLGTLPLSIEDPPAGPYTVGLYYDTRTETLPPVITDDVGDRAGDLMRIVSGTLHVRSSLRFKVGSYELMPYQVTDDPNEPPPARTGPIKFGFLGWRREPTIVVTQPDPLPLKILGATLEVAF